MRRPLFKYLFILICGMMAACTDMGQPENPLPDDTLPKQIELTSFRFRKNVNIYQLDRDIEGVISGDTIIADLRGGGDIDITRLIPTFDGEYEEVWVGNREQVSDASPQDFTEHVLYRLKGADGSQRTYRVFVRTGSGLPVVNITTVDRQAVTSKEKYVEGGMIMTNIIESGGYLDCGVRIRVRGNATAGYDKKPYRIKLDRKEGLLGFPEHKDWILLAEYCDKSLLRTSYMWELSKIAGMEWTCRGRHVDLYLNGWYRGVYLLCENVTRDEHRVNIAADGFIIENDGYWHQEPVWFRTGTGRYYTFKYPDGDKDITAGDDNYNYISAFMERLEKALYSEGFKDPDTGYRKYLDPVSFARWFLVQEVLGNIDTNPYFVLERGGKLKMYPLWDADWSIGLAANGGPGPYGWVYPPNTSPVDKLYWKDNGYFARLTQDPWFCDLLRAEWAVMKSRLPEFKDNVGAIADNIKYAQEQNFKYWNILGKYVAVGLVAFDSWQQEVEYAAGFLDKRIEWFDDRIKEFPD